MDIVGDLSRIRTLLSESVVKKSDEQEALMDLLTFLIPDDSVYLEYFGGTYDLRKIYMKYSVDKKNTQLEKQNDDEYYDAPSTSYVGVVFLNIEKLNILDNIEEIIIEDADFYDDIPEYVWEELEDKLGALCFRYGLNVHFDYIGNGTNEGLAH